MSAETSAQPVQVPAASDLPAARPDDAAIEEGKVGVAANTGNGVNKAPLTNKTEDINGPENKHLPSELTPQTENKPTTGAEDAGMNSQIEMEAPASLVADEAPADPATATPASSSKSKARRKSAVIPEHKSKKLNRKASKVKMSHSDAKPGDYYFIRLKGYPLWPGIVCDESMLPQSLISTRPVTAARPDGTYRADYEDGGKKIHDRTFPVMYLHTNEFGWIPNYDLVDLDLEEVGKVDQKMRKDLYQAHLLAAEKHELSYFKELLLEYQAQREAEAEAKAAAKAAKEASKSSGKKKKSKANKDAEEEGVEDVDMVDAEGDLDIEGEVSEKKPKPSKKRKAVADPEESNTPQASSSTKKLKFKPMTQSVPKAANGATPKSTSKKDSTTKPFKPKSKKSSANGVVEKVAAIPKEPELTPEEKRAKKEKEILFLRHKLQKGLLTRDQQPKEEEMKGMSEYISKLEGYADLEVSIIRATKINKVLKAILKLTEIPKESDFQFKDRSKSLLEKWNKILESAEQPASAATPAPVDEAASKELTNGVSIAPKAEDGDGKDGENENKAKELAAHADADSALQDAAAKDILANESKPAEDSIVHPAPEPVAV